MNEWITSLPPRCLDVTLLKTVRFVIVKEAMGLALMCTLFFLVIIISPTFHIFFTIPDGPNQPACYHRPKSYFIIYFWHFTWLNSKWENFRFKETSNSWLKFSQPLPNIWFWLFGFSHYNFQWFMTMHLWFIMRNMTNKCIYGYINLLHYKQCSPLHVSATYCGYHQGGVLWRIQYTDSVTSRHNTTISAWMVSPHAQNITTALGTNNFNNISYFNTDFKLLFKISYFIFVN